MPRYSVCNCSTYRFLCFVLPINWCSSRHKALACPPPHKVLYYCGWLSHVTKYRYSHLDNRVSLSQLTLQVPEHPKDTLLMLQTWNMYMPTQTTYCLSDDVSFGVGWHIEHWLVFIGNLISTNVKSIKLVILIGVP